MSLLYGYTATNPVSNHHSCKIVAVDQHNSLAHIFGRPTRCFGERGGRRKQALGRLELIERSEKIANCAGAYGIFAVPLRLNIDAVKPERVLIDDSINASITAFSECAGGVRRRAP